MATKIKIHKQYDQRESKGIVFEDESLTKQSSKDECDINVIMRRFEKTGTLPDLIKKEPRYGDFSDPMEYQTACNLVIHAQSQFDSLDSRVRERFANDPEKFLEFASDPRNGEEMVTLGLATKRPMEPKGDASKGDSKKKSPEKTPPVPPEE
nr:MAG: internal scaffolding protein [Microvirus sp.]